MKKSFTKTEIRKGKRFFSEKELWGFSEDANESKNKIEELEGEARSVAAEYKAKIGILKAMEKDLRSKLTSRFETTDIYVFVRRDYDKKLVYYINRDTLEVIDVEKFTPRDEMKQLDINEEEIKSMVEDKTIENQSTPFFNSILAKMENDANAGLERKELEGKEINFIGGFIRHCQENELLELSSPVSFDTAYETILPLFVAWLDAQYELEGSETPVPLRVHYNKRKAKWLELTGGTTLATLAEYVSKYFVIEPGKKVGFTMVGETSDMIFVDTLTLSEIQVSEDGFVNIAFHVIDNPEEIGLLPVQTEPVPTIADETETKEQELIDGLPVMDLEQSVPPLDGPTEDVILIEGEETKEIGAPFDEDLTDKIEEAQEERKNIAASRRKPTVVDSELQNELKAAIENEGGKVPKAKKNKKSEKSE